MLTKDLNIKTIDNKFVITVEKTEITSEYLNELLNWLKFQRSNFSKKSVKNVNQIKNKSQCNKPQTINKQSKNKRVWNYSGSINLNHQIDKINLRDFAYE